MALALLRTYIYLSCNWFFFPCNLRWGRWVCICAKCAFCFLCFASEQVVKDRRNSESEKVEYSNKLNQLTDNIYDDYASGLIGCQSAKRNRHSSPPPPLFSSDCVMCVCVATITLCTQRILFHTKYEPQHRHQDNNQAKPSHRYFFV